MSEERNDLVVYRPQPLDFAKHIQPMQTPLRNLNPETRIVSKEDMYAGGFYGLEWSKYGIEGHAYVRYLHAAKEGNTAEPGLLERMTKKLFGERTADEFFGVMHDGKKYKQQWFISTSDDGKYKKILFRLNMFEHRLVPDDFPVELKTKVASQKNILISNELFRELFDPLIDSVIQICGGMARF